MLPGNNSYLAEEAFHRIDRYQAEARKEALAREAKSSSSEELYFSLTFRQRFGYFLIGLGNRLAGNTQFEA